MGDGWRAAGARIDALIAADPAGREDLVREVTDLYGAGLERLLDVLHEAGALTDDVLAAVAADELRPVQPGGRGDMTDSPLAALRRIARSRPEPPAERCDMCATPLAGDHSHVVDRETRRLMCACRPCYLLFTDDGAHLRYRAVPDRYVALAEPVLDDLPIPVGLAFLFRNSAQDRVVACYPGPAGVTESELELPVAGHPVLADLRPDVEALLIRRGTAGYLVPIDVCYELAGRLRTVWRGFDGGREAHEVIDAFFARLRERTS